MAQKISLDPFQDSASIEYSSHLLSIPTVSIVINSSHHDLMHTYPVLPSIPESRQKSRISHSQEDSPHLLGVRGLRYEPDPEPVDRELPGRFRPPPAEDPGRLLPLEPLCVFASKSRVVVSDLLNEPSVSLSICVSTSARVVG